MTFDQWLKKLKPAECDETKEYFVECWNAALEEAHAWMLQRHQAQKHRDNYMLVEANRFKKELLK